MGDGGGFGPSDIRTYSITDLKKIIITDRNGNELSLAYRKGLKVGVVKPSRKTLVGTLEDAIIDKSRQRISTFLVVRPLRKKRKEVIIDTHLYGRMDWDSLTLRLYKKTAVVMSYLN